MRCSEHGLVAAPDGKCVLCRRADGTRAPNPAASTLEPRTVGREVSWLGPLGLSGAMVGLALAVFLASRSSAGLGVFAPADLSARLQAERPPPCGEPIDPETYDPYAPTMDELDRVANDTERPDPKALPTDREYDGAELRQKLRDVRVTVYYTTWCPHCTRARKWLDSRQIPYQALDVEASPVAAREQRKLNPRGGVPTIVVDEHVMVGFDAQELELRLEAAARKRLRRGE